MSLTSWLLWAFVLILQNFTFTFVSRARNSGSLRRHMIASVFSNGVWFISQMLIFTTLFAIMTGKYGIGQAVFASFYYTVFTMAGSLAAHYYSLKTEKGKSRVGAFKDVATFTTVEGEIIRKRALFVDTGDGIGTFTPDELSKIKELIGSKVEIVDEIITESLPQAVPSSMCWAAAPVLAPMPGQGKE